MIPNIKHSHRLRTFTLCLVAAGTLTAGTLFAIVQTTQTPDQPPAQEPIKTQPGVKGQEPSPVNISPKANEAPETHTWTTQQILTCTVSQCWQLSGKNEEEFFDIIQDLAAISAENRNLVLPQSEAAGRQAGEMIKARAKTDREQLLFAIVDAAVRKVGKPGPAN